jgi:type II secretory pathway pseudopilin PulG
MMNRIPIRRQPKPSEEGYILVAVIFMLALLMIAMAVAAPVIKKEIQRDRDLETMERGKQYARAIKLYYKKFNAYPPNVDALVKTNEIRFLRKRYTDPITGKDDWKPIRFGQNKVPTAMGFFGQPLGGSTLAGTGPSGGNGVATPPRAAAGLSAPAAWAPARPRLPAQQAVPATPPAAARFPPRIRTWAGKRGRPLAERALSAFLLAAPSSPSWFTRRRTTTTSGNSPTTRSPNA